MPTPKKIKKKNHQTMKKSKNLKILYQLFYLIYPSIHIHVKVEFSENVSLKEEYQDFDSCQSIIDKLENIRRKFLNLNSKTNEFPPFYSVDLLKLSRNDLQSKK